MFNCKNLCKSYMPINVMSVLLTKTLHYLINNVLTAILPGESGSAGCPIHIPCSFPLPRHCTSVHPLGTSPNSSYPPGQSPTESSSDEPSCLLPATSIVIQLLIQLASPVCPTCQTVSVKTFWRKSVRHYCNTA